MKVTLLVITDGRATCLMQSVRAFDLCVDTRIIERRVIVDDSGDPDYGDWIDRDFAFDDHIRTPTKAGFAGAIAAGWEAVGGAPWVFHLEDDFVLSRHLPLGAMVEVLQANPQLAQMALRRQSWGPEELLHGGYIGADPGAFVDCHDLRNPDRHWMEHRKFFSTNASLYPDWIIKQGWPQVADSRVIFAADLFNNPQAACGIWGQRTDQPWAIHVGYRRVGTGY